MTATVGRIAKVTSEAALAVEVDHSTTKGAVVYPVPMVGAGHSSDPVRSMSPAEMIVCGRWVEERMSDDGAGAADMSTPMVG